MISLTPQQAAAKRFISDYMAAQKASLTYAAIRNGLGLRRRSSAKRLVNRLVDRGHAKLSPSGIVLINETVSRAPDGGPLYFVPVEGAPQ